jgi:predicted DNA-binding protein
LEKTTSKNKDYYVREALFRHLEDLEDLQTALKIKRSKTLSKTITDEELGKKLNSWWPTTTN